MTQAGACQQGDFVGRDVKPEKILIESVIVANDEVRVRDIAPIWT
jgi:hypothetical protein